MSRTVRISRTHHAQEICAIRPVAMVFAVGEYSNPGACANGTGMLASAVLHVAGQP